MSDWTIAFDAMLCERPRTCMQCGGVAQRLELRVVEGKAWAVAMCRRCLSLDPECVRLEARLQAYRGQP